MVTREIVGLVRAIAIEADDLATELAGTTYGGFQSRPALSKFIVAREQHFALGLKFKLVAEPITLVDGEEILETFLAEIRVG